MINRPHGGHPHDVGSSPELTALAAFERARLAFNLTERPTLKEIARLRVHVAHVDGDSPALYEEPAYLEHLQSRRHRLAELSSADDPLSSVPLEPELLGSFGLPCGERLINRASLDHHEIIVGLSREGLLADDSALWIVGDGWGGLAATLHELCPSRRLFLTDDPLRLAQACAYLQARFPDVAIALGKDDGRAPLVLLPADATGGIDAQRLVVRQSTALTEELWQCVRPMNITHLYAAVPDESPIAGDLHPVFDRLAREGVVHERPLVRVASPAAGTFRLDQTANDLRHFVVEFTRPIAPTEITPVALGLTVHNGGSFLRSALDSILQQSHRLFTLTVVDDGSTDDSAAILAEYAARDSRLELHCNTPRLGMVRAWQQAFELASKHQPACPYFAWISDHDLWDPRWLERLVTTLDAQPDTVIAYPLCHSIGLAGELQGRKCFRYESPHKAPLADRFHSARQHLHGAGNMVYGLYRRSALEECGVFRPVLQPDRVLLMELSLQGAIVQQQEFLWIRRRTGTPSLRRQRRALFTDENRPIHVYLPWWAVHAWCVGRYHHRWLLALRLFLTDTRRELYRHVRRALHPIIPRSWIDVVRRRRRRTD